MTDEIPWYSRDVFIAVNGEVIGRLLLSEDLAIALAKRRMWEEIDNLVEHL